MRFFYAIECFHNFSGILIIDCLNYLSILKIERMIFLPRMVINKGKLVSPSYIVRMLIDTLLQISPSLAIITCLAVITVKSINQIGFFPINSSILHKTNLLLNCIIWFMRKFYVKWSKYSLNSFWSTFYVRSTDVFYFLRGVDSNLVSSIYRVKLI
jgi:hypothetical protein